VEKVFSLFGKLATGIVIAAILVGGGIYLGLRGQKSKQAAPTSTPSVNRVVSLSPTPNSAQNPSISPTPAGQTINITGTSPFVSYSVSIPNGWKTSKETIGGRIKLTVSAGDYNVIISQAAGGGATCVYPGQSGGEFSSPFNAASGITGDGGQFRRATQQGSDTTGPQNYFVCEQKGSTYSFPTQFGYINYNTAQNPSDDSLKVLDQIVASIKKQ